MGISAVRCKWPQYGEEGPDRGPSLIEHIKDNQIKYMPIIEHNSPLTWRDKRYKQFYQIVDQLVEEIQAGLRGKDGGAVRRLGNAIWIV